MKFSKGLKEGAVVLNKSALISIFTLILCLNLMFFIIAFSPNWNTSGYRHEVDGVGYDTVNPPIGIGRKTSENIKNLTAILTAISKYENDHYAFPVSSESGNGWSSPVYGINDNWIKGLVPVYIESIPEDESKSDRFNYNFLYKSDGINFKLIAHRPGDCEEVKNIYPQIIDSKRNCYAYGYWTQGAKNW